MTPLYFADCFGWLHAAEGQRGVVICSPMAIEELCMHRFMRHLADQLAAAGLPTLRFDYHGTGDSFGTDFDPERVQSWLLSIRQAIDCLRHETGVQEVVLVGVRLGALLATEVARQLGAISMLALLAPAISGKSYAREMKALGTFIAQSGRATVPATAEQSDDSVTEVAGFAMTMETASALRELDLLALSQPPAPKVLITGRANSAVDLRLADHLRRLGCAVEQAEWPGYAEFEWNTSFAALPPNTFTAIVQWLVRDQSKSVATTPQSIAAHKLSTVEWQEEPVLFGPQQRLFGVCCRPTDSSNQAHIVKLVLFINHGSNHHVGWARMHVTFARLLAAHGIASLRIDISGVGDSPSDPKYPENLLYARHSQYDVYAALDWLRDRGYRAIILVGHCAGAYLAFYSALRDPRVSGLIMLNLQRFFWARGDSLEIASRKGFRASDWYWRMLRNPDVWRRLITGKINVFGISRTLLQRFVQRRYRTALNIAGSIVGRQTLGSKVVSWLRELSARGTYTLLVYSAEDSGLDEIASHTGKNARKLRKLANIQFKIIEGADHNLTPIWARQRYMKLLEDFLLRMK